MSNLRRRAPALGLLLALALTLSGCVHADRSVQLNADGSGSYTFTLGFSDQVLSLGGTGLADQMRACGDNVKTHGGSYRQYEDSGYSNWAFTWPFKTVTALNSLMQDASALCGAAGSSVDSASNLSASATDFFKVTEKPGFFSNTFHATGQMSMMDFSSPVDPATAELLKDARESFAITFPGFVSAHAGGVVSGNTVTFTVHYNEATTIDATGGGFNAGAILAVVALALVMVVGVVVVFFLLRRRKPATIFADGGSARAPVAGDDVTLLAPVLPSSTPPADPSSGSGS